MDNSSVLYLTGTGIAFIGRNVQNAVPVPLFLQKDYLALQRQISSKGEKGCESKHIDDVVLYQAFVNVFNAMEILEEVGRINEFAVDLYFALVEKITVYNGGRLIVSLLDGTGIEREI